MACSRLLTLSGVKPLGTWQWHFKAFWLYEAVESATGEQFFWQFSHVDSDCYQRFLNEFSAFYADTLNILQVDNGAFYKAKNLTVPNNIILLFQPAYCPELNPIERLWQHLKKDSWGDRGAKRQSGGLCRKKPTFLKSLAKSGV